MTRPRRAGGFDDQGAPGILRWGSGPARRRECRPPGLEHDFCNGRLAITTTSDPVANLRDCVHIDDVATAFPPPEKG